MKDEELQGLARLARLALTGEEVRGLARDVGNILQWARGLEGVGEDLEKVYGDASGEWGVEVGGERLRMEEDEGGGEAAREDILANGADVRDGFFVVPRVVEVEE